MRKSLLLPLVLAFALLGAGCAHHRHHHAPPAKVVVHEHDDPAIVVVHTKPAPKRHCWKHGRHWHCRR